ncbi:MAG: cellulase family glycosylhydrolase, partial [Muribaculaceae bacterium]|nr:cellulase family glycosylhydrolase [Muribaculaceae bacterium]
RYADDPAIMAWEIGNEPRAFGGEENKTAFARWMAEASARIKSHDPNHLVTTGSEGMCGCEGDYALFETIHADPNVDYMTIHVWPKNWGWLGDCPNEERLDAAIRNTMGYVADHAVIARRHGKPMVMEEFGFPRDSMKFTPGSATTLRDRYYDAVFGLIDNSTLAGCNIWAWGGFARPDAERVFWAPGDDYTGDPAQEEQGLNSVFACDSSTLEVIRRHSPLTRTPAADLASRLKSVVADSRYVFGHSDDTAYGHSWAYESGRSDVKEVCGDYPGLINWDLGMIEYGSADNLDGVPFDLISSEIVAQNQRGGISSISWHPRNPATGGDTWDTSGTGVSAGVAAGTAMNDTLKRWIGRVADFIGALRDEDGHRIPVVLRPWHEHTGSWFWWGQNSCSADEYKALWIMTRREFDARGIDNVLWAYSPSVVSSVDEYMERYPGDCYVDILGADIYLHGGDVGLDDYRASVRATFDVVAAIAGQRGKIVAFTETGSEGVPMSDWWSEVLGPLCSEYPVAYVCVWRNAHDKPEHFFGPYKGHESEQSFVKFYDSPLTVFASDMR